MKTAMYRVIDSGDCYDVPCCIEWLCCGSNDTDPKSNYKFCPFCGTAGATRLECRESDTPRWAYERPHLDWRSLVREARTKDTRWVLERREKSPVTSTPEAADSFFLPLSDPSDMDWRYTSSTGEQTEYEWGLKWSAWKETDDWVSRSNILEVARSAFKKDTELIIQYRLRFGDGVIEPESLRRDPFAEYMADHPDVEDIQDAYHDLSWKFAFRDEIAVADARRKKGSSVMEDLLNE